ncbi:2-hydroxyacid dehydrogenase (plasmid) [Thioclava sp. 'Guangxiensis']|uniref:2-hydroxyacid dehydrogenase n=1 Tax=Thioclava sp. 'Guangxiensis' TaxID=3149044 RepID=UPI0032C4480B
MKPRILQTGALSPGLDARLAEEFDVLRLWECDTPLAALAESGAPVRGIATSAPVGVPDDLLAALPDLEVISCRGVGLDRIDLASCRARGIQVAGTFGVLSDCVADLALGLMIDAARRISEAERFVRAGRWSREKFPLATRISGQRLGIVGLGQIGQAVARRAAAFDMEIRYTGRMEKIGQPWAYEDSLVELAAWADMLVLTVSGGASTEGMVSAEVLEALGPRGYLINVARGSVVDEAALLGALAGGGIAGAALDVFADEPHVPEAFLALENVVLLPHIGSGTKETRRDMEALVLRNLQSYFRTGAVVTPAPDLGAGRVPQSLPV